MESLIQKKTLLIEIAIVVLFLAGGYYLYSMFTENSETVTTTTVNEQLFGQNFILLLKAINQDRVSFKDAKFLDSPFVSQMRDFSETIGVNETRGRVDPFVPYASSRPLR